MLNNKQRTLNKPRARLIELYNQISSNKKESMISVLIPARNEEKNILNILRDMSAQNYHNYEVLIFDDQSADRTAEIVNNFTKKN